MNAQDFRQDLDALTDAELIGPCLREEIVPFVFEPNPPNWDRFRDEFVTRLQVSRSDIRVVGSARFGFSMKPDRNLKTFGDRSDVDVVVVNERLFDDLWHALLIAAYPRPPVSNELGGWLKQRRNELYTGWLTPVEIRLDPKIHGTKTQSALHLKTLWFNTLKIASQHVPRRHEDVNGRLYRTWKHAELYHLHSIGALRQTLTD
jgi:hypothetical protein